MFRLTGALTVDEQKNSIEKLISMSQKESFPREYSTLLKGKPLHSCIFCVSGWGGRLQQSNFEYVFLSSKHAFTKFCLNSNLLLGNTTGHLVDEICQNVSLVLRSTRNL